MFTPVPGCSLLGVQPMLHKALVVVEVKVWIKNRWMVIITQPMLFKVLVVVEVKVWIKNRWMVIFTHLGGEYLSYISIYYLLIMFMRPVELS